MDITFEHVTHVYGSKTPFEKLALDDVSLHIPSGSFTSIIGHTGSGKSTLVQHINGLLKPSKGTITVGDVVIKAGAKKQDLKSLREKVGFVFQYPEHQLFEETIIKDVCFGPMNFGISESEAIKRAEESLQMVGLPASLWHRSPFDLSGGQMRRVAIAGVLAVRPQAVILDEPTAGLDPKGRQEILGLFKSLHERQHLTIIMVTHSMDDAAVLSDQVVAMKGGKPLIIGTPKDVFIQKEKLRAAGLDLPETMTFLNKLLERAGEARTIPAFTIDEAADAVVNLLNGVRDHV
ncbi:energy-coupling factor transporter ATPase [Sporolactobacillus terrae]|uniref:Energy-coupling factor transporter ATP-binding protein EcfA2 n=1 Tax=Sporolactobacillus terrae TaxID=269673 RepID=A0A410D5D4_9BACL|nr:energy-coupling factor transporter ATPase [Sporolactobacillus terrae]QAA21303.1 energy-coupling factor transporter ATPase [Sporolactobacillus terrae]QAA24275.1 energy-coupling factor transporter ATPase [Sporolactobacillus terrae]UAK16079.1 energy-coupling factor transporter ATPase [Sporolactobacillus terrae]BBN97444.1 energy-coupling factor transporter ATP-binding protein EcfA2 [Sporolactobacillus terrae]